MGYFSKVKDSGLLIGAFLNMKLSTIIKKLLFFKLYSVFLSIKINLNLTRDFPKPPQNQQKNFQSVDDVVYKGP